MPLCTHEPTASVSDEGSGVRPKQPHCQAGLGLGGKEEVQNHPGGIPLVQLAGNLLFGAQDALCVAEGKADGIPVDLGLP